MTFEKNKNDIVTAQTSLGIELGSTRIKAVLINHEFQEIASGSFQWENQLIDGIWTYDLQDVWQGIQQAYGQLKATIEKQYQVQLTKIGSIGFSAMMHGYLVFDQDQQLLTPFRTWRNAITAEAEEKLSHLFNFNIPQRWSIAHLYQAIMNQESHVAKIDFMTTLAGYVHWQLTGEKVLGIGDASGMFPIDPKTKQFRQDLMVKFHELVHQQVDLNKILPQVLVAGQDAGRLTTTGAKLLDPSGDLQSGILLCPPEGDAGTGMVATNSITKRTGNISVGTSVFAMVVLEKQLQQLHPEIDVVTTPHGNLVAMVHANNGSSDINAWIKLIKEAIELFGVSVDDNTLYQRMFELGLSGDKSGGGLMSYGYLSGENITKIVQGRPIFVREPNSDFSLATFFRIHLNAVFGALAMGMEILHQEGVHVDSMVGHGGFFKTPKVGATIVSAAMASPITLLKTASEGGAWGMALLASYSQQSEESLESFLNRVFSAMEATTTMASAEDIEAYQVFLRRYQAGLIITKAAETWPGDEKC